MHSPNRKLSTIYRSYLHFIPGSILICAAGLCALLVLAACAPAAEVPLTASAASATAVPSATPAPTRTPQPTFTPTATPLPACFSESGRIVETSYPGAVVDGDVPVVISLPPCYDENADHYPVLYLLHGFGSGMDETHWAQIGVIEEAERRFHAGEAPYILVMPLQPDPVFVNSMGGPGSYEQEVLDGLMPYIDGNYRTIPEAETRALAGISRGGVWALEIGFRNPAQFDIVMGISAALHLNYVRAEYDPSEIVKTASQLPTHIYLTAGDQERDFRGAMLELSTVLEEEGIVHTANVHIGGHSNPTWQNLLPDLLDYIAEIWGMGDGDDLQR